jgi:DNA-binding NtrC family response regulator
VNQTLDERLTPIVSELIDSGITLPQAVEAFEQKYLVTALKRQHGNITQAARLLGVHRNTLMNKRPVTPGLMRKRALMNRKNRRGR